MWSPDGTSIAYLQGSEPTLSAYNQHSIAVMPSVGGVARLVAPTLDRDVSALTWTADGAALRFLLGDDRAVHLATVPASGGAVVDGSETAVGLRSGCSLPRVPPNK